MNWRKNQLYLLEEHSESFKSWSAIIMINTEGKSLVEKSVIRTLEGSRSPFVNVHARDESKLKTESPKVQYICCLSFPYLCVYIVSFTCV